MATCLLPFHGTSGVAETMGMPFRKVSIAVAAVAVLVPTIALCIHAVVPSDSKIFDVDYLLKKDPMVVIPELIETIQILWLEHFHPSEATVQAFAVWKAALGIAGRDIYSASHSTAYALFLTLRPLVGLVGWASHVFVVRVLYETVVLRGIASPTAVRQMKRAARRGWEWQRSLTPQQWAMEVGGLVALYLLVALMKLLQRRKYLERIKQWGRRKRRALGQVYAQQLKRLATVSVWLAIMTPHTLFAWGVVFAKLLVPGACAWLANETRLASVFHTYYPLLATIWLLYDVSVAMELGGIAAKIKKHAGETVAATKPSKPKDRRKSVRELVTGKRDEDGDNSASNSISLNERKTFWMHYWTVCSALCAGKRLFHIIPFAARLFLYPTVMSILNQLEVVFWIWINLLPALMPLHYQKSPIEFLATRFLGPPISRAVNKVTDLIPNTTWQTFCVETSAKFLSVAVWSKMVSQPTADWLTHVVEESRSLLLPALSVLSWPLQSYGIVYVAYALPVAKTYQRAESLQKYPGTGASHDPSTLQLEYWVLHTVLTTALLRLLSALWWIPLSGLPFFAVYAYMATTNDLPYDVYIQQELQAFGILPASSKTASVHETKAARAFFWVVQKLPKAAANENDGDVNIAEVAMETRIESEIIEAERTAALVTDASAVIADDAERSHASSVSSTSAVSKTHSQQSCTEDEKENGPNRLSNQNETSSRSPSTRRRARRTIA